jgi:hypothetical protein
MSHANQKLHGIIDELIKMEKIFCQPVVTLDRLDIENLFHEQFLEIGASGQQYSRKHSIDVLLDRKKNPCADIWESKDFHYLDIERNSYLLTYTLIQNNERVTRRATLWQNCDDRWQAIYHQGTIVQNSKTDLEP